MVKEFVKMSQIDYKEEKNGQGMYVFYLQYDDNEDYLKKLADNLDNYEQLPYDKLFQSTIYIDQPISEKDVDEYCKAKVDNFFGQHFKVEGKLTCVPPKESLYKDGICNYFSEIIENKFVKMSQIDFKEEIDGCGIYTYYLQYNGNKDYLRELANILNNCDQKCYGDTSRTKIYINNIISEEEVDVYCKAKVDNYFGCHFKLTGKMSRIPLEIDSGMSDREKTLEIDKYLYKNNICKYFSENKYK